MKENLKILRTQKMRNEQKLLPRPGINQSSFEPSVFEPGIFSLTLSQLSYLSKITGSGNEGHVTHTGLKRRLSSHAFVKRKRCIQTSEAISVLDIFEGKFENSQNSKDEE